MALPAREIAASAAKTVGSFREAIQDLLVPELRALKVSMEAIRTEMHLRDERQTNAITSLQDSMKAMDERQTRAITSLQDSMKAMDERQTRALEAQDERQTRALEVQGERLTRAIEAQGERLTGAIEAQGERLTRSIEAFVEEMRLRDAYQTRNIQSLSAKLDVALDVRERLAQVESRLPKQ